MMLQEGRVFAGRYVVERFLACGGMGAVYVARHLGVGRRFALKVLSPKALESKAALEGFRLEACVKGRVGDSEHIVDVVDAGTDEATGLHFLVMELLRGLSLQELVRQRGPLSPAEVLVVMGDVARALDQTHGCRDERGDPSPIVHRDLKPTNLFLSLRERGDVIVKVLDFGIAKVVHDSQNHTAALRGTPPYMAYEQIKPGRITPRLDIWAFGLITFYLLTGRHYWLTKGCDGPWPLCIEILNDPLDPASERARALGLAVDWPAAFDGWFARCVNRDIEARFASAGAAVKALREAFASEGQLTAGAINAARAALARKVRLALEAAAAPPPYPPICPVANSAPAAPPGPLALEPVPPSGDSLLPSTKSSPVAPEVLPPKPSQEPAPPPGPECPPGGAPSKRHAPPTVRLIGAGLTALVLGAGLGAATFESMRTTVGSAPSGSPSSAASAVPIVPPAPPAALAPSAGGGAPPPSSGGAVDSSAGPPAPTNAPHPPPTAPRKTPRPTPSPPKPVPADAPTASGSPPAPTPAVTSSATSVPSSMPTSPMTSLPPLPATSR